MKTALLTLCCSLSALAQTETITPEETAMIVSRWKENCRDSTGDDCVPAGVSLDKGTVVATPEDIAGRKEKIATFTTVAGNPEEWSSGTEYVRFMHFCQVKKGPAIQFDMALVKLLGVGTVEDWLRSTFGQLGGACSNDLDVTSLMNRIKTVRFKVIKPKPKQRCAAFSLDAKGVLTVGAYDGGLTGGDCDNFARFLQID